MRLHATGSKPTLALAAALAFGCAGDARQETGDSESAIDGDGWDELFNGVDLTGWTPKITGQQPGDDPFGTFRVEDGLLVVGYEGYDEFGARFGHLFHARPLADYDLIVEYRFVGEQLDGGPGWAFRNSGVMFHSQAPSSMTLEQDFPISLEVQFLGGNGTDDRPTANLCTPGTHVEMEGELIESHCITAAAPTIHGDEWVTVELHVRGDSVRHVMDGVTVLAYERPVVGGGEANGYDPAVRREGEQLREGYIALQSESHPIHFRRVAVRRVGR